MLSRISIDDGVRMFHATFHRTWQKNADLWQETYAHILIIGISLLNLAYEV